MILNVHSPLDNVLIRITQRNKENIENNHDNMNDYKRFAQRIGLIGFTNILIALSSIILLPILTNNLNVNEYGIWIQISVTLNLMSALTTLGLPYTMVRYFPAFKSEEIKESFLFNGICNCHYYFNRRQFILFIFKKYFHNSI